MSRKIIRVIPDLAIAPPTAGWFRGLLRNAIFCHPFTLFRAGSDPEHIPLRFTQGQCKLREGEGSRHRRDSAPFGLRMTKSWAFRNTPLAESKPCLPVRQAGRHRLGA